MNQGYLIVATGPDKYLWMARACASSIRFWDREREIQLLTDRRDLESSSLAAMFDVISVVEVDEKFLGPAIKLLINKYTVFEQTMFVDSDCLMVKGDIDRYWTALASKYAVSIPGQWACEGRWYGVDIKDICEAFDVKKIVRMNSGAIYFEKNDISDNFFSVATNLYQNHGNFTGHIHNGLGVADEPYFAIAFAKTNINPFEIRDKNGDAWMLSTIGAYDYVFDRLAGAARFNKGGMCSPTLCHFVALRPEELYKKLSEEYLASLV